MRGPWYISARAALSASPPGVRVGLTTEERAELKAILDQRGPGRLTVLARKLLDGEGT